MIWLRGITKIGATAKRTLKSLTAWVSCHSADFKDRAVPARAFWGTLLGATVGGGMMIALGRDRAPWQTSRSTCPCAST